MPQRKPKRVELTMEKSLAGILALLIAEREECVLPEDAPRTEVILASAGLTPAEIAPLLGKQTDAVRKSIERAR